jgi:hypothetical protein
MISSGLLEVLSRMNVPMVVFLGDEEDGEESELLKEMKRHHKLQEEMPILLPSPG